MPDKKSHFSPQIQSQNDINVFPLAILSEKSPKDPTRTSSAGRSGDPAHGVVAKRKSRFIGELNIDD